MANILVTINQSLNFDIEKKEWNIATVDEVVKYFKGRFTNKKRFINRVIEPLRAIKSEKDMFVMDEELEKMIDIYDKVEPYSYQEAFEIENQQFQALVFGSINITEMMEELGKERIKADGKFLKHKQFSPEGEYQGMVEYDVVYETYEVDGTKLGLNEKVYALKCWCTSTNEEHWLWIDEKYKNDPLEAVASTFMVHENVIPHIKEIKRQGDILLVETGDTDVTPEGEMVSLTADQYFGFLTCQS